MTDDVKMSVAERLAKYWTTKNCQGEYLYSSLGLREDTAAELRRLAAENEQLAAYTGALNERCVSDAAEIDELRADRDRLAAEVEALRSMLREARDTIDTLPGYPKGADLCDRIDAIDAAKKEAQR